MKAIAFAALLAASMPAMPQVKTESQVRGAFSAADFSTNIQNVREFCVDQGATAAAKSTGVDAYVAKKETELNCVRRFRPAIVTQAAAKSAEAGAAAAQATQDEVNKKEDEKKEADSRKNFLNMSWGLGLGVSLGKKHVTDAEIVNGIVRVKTEEKYQPRVVLEAHQYLWFKGDADAVGTSGLGPFAAIVAGSSESAISAFGLGLMYGIKGKDQEGFSLGVGIIVDQKVKNLGAGFESDQPAPAGETAVRFEEKSRASWLIFFSRTF